MTEYYTALIFFAVFTMLILTSLAAKNDALSKRVKYGVIISSFMILAAAACEYLGVVLNGADVSLRALHILAKFLELSLAPMIPVVFGCAIYPVKSVRFLVIPLALHTLVEFLSSWLGIIFYVDLENVYYHCEFYWIYYAAYLFGALFLIFQVIRFSRCYQSINRLSLFLIMLFVLAGIFWQITDGSVKVVWFSVAMGDTMFYTYYCDILQQTDNLTQLLNRRSYDNHMKFEKRRAVIIMADVDAFKAVNDNFGHRFGDICLAEVGSALKDAYGSYGLCYRIGGDEFCVVLERRLALVEKLNTVFFGILEAKRFFEPNLPYVSIGYAKFDPSEMTIDQAAEQADKMMYEFKQKSQRRYN